LKNNTDEVELTDNDEYFRIRQEKQQVAYDQLRIAYRPLLPNDIYKTYYSKRFINRKTSINNKNAKC
jgi:hypothetical protein